MPSMILLALASEEKNVTHSNNNDLVIPTKDGLDKDLYYYSTTFYSAAALFEAFLYGVYVSLFILCLHVLLKNKRIPKVLLSCAILMFALASVDVALEILYLFLFVIKTNNIPDANLHYKFLVYITSNVVADSLVIYRCFMIWNYDKRVIVLPCLMLFSGSACGYIFIGLSQQEYRFRELLIAFLFTTVSLNILVTVLMAGRIWWIARRAKSITGPGLSKKYTTVIAMIVESGVIYSIYVVMDVVFPNFLLDAGLAQVVGIVPTMMIVQVGLSRTGDDANTAASIVRSERVKSVASTLDTPVRRRRHCRPLSVERSDNGMVTVARGMMQNGGGCFEVEGNNLMLDV